MVTHKDRLLCFGAELIFFSCKEVGGKVVIINASEEASYEDDLTRGVLEIMTVFSARLYGSRLKKHKEIMKKLQEGAHEIRLRDTLDKIKMYAEVAKAKVKTEVHSHTKDPQKRERLWALFLNKSRREVLACD